MIEGIWPETSVGFSAHTNCKADNNERHASGSEYFKTAAETSTPPVAKARDQRRNDLGGSGSESQRNKRQDLIHIRT